MAILPSFAFIATYNPAGDSSLQPSAVAVLVPTQVSGLFVVPSTPVFVVWSVTNIVQVRITGDNGIDPPVDSGLITTTGLTSGSFEMANGFTHDITLTFVAYDTVGHVAVTQLLPVPYASGAMTGITISPLNPIIPAGTTQQFTAIAVFADSSTAPLLHPAWASSDLTNATIDSTGLATGLTAGGGGTTISATFNALSGSTHLGVSNDITRIPALVDSEGNGSAWVSTAAATASGFGTNLSVGVPSFSISNGVATFNTTQNSFVAGQPVTINYTLTTMDGQTLIVNAAGLSSTSFTANTSASNKSLTYGAASATPTTNYAYAGRYDVVTPGAGQNATYVQGGVAPLASTGTGGHNSFAGFLPVYLQTGTAGSIGINGTPLGPNNVSSTGSSVPAPTLPAGATVVAVYAYLTATASGGAYQAYQVFYPSTHYTFPLNVPSNNASARVLIGTDVSVIQSSYFKATILSSLEASAPGYSSSSTVQSFGYEVVYTLPGSQVITVPGQIQDLTSKQFNFALPPPSSVLGVQVQFASGLAAGSGSVTLTIQLTVNGTPVGTPKTQLLNAWDTGYTFGGSTDLWGLTSLTDADVNDVVTSPPAPSGLGVIVSATLPDQSQINLNSMEATLWYY